MRDTSLQLKRLSMNLNKMICRIKEIKSDIRQLPEEFAQKAGELLELAIIAFAQAAKIEMKKSYLDIATPVIKAIDISQLDDNEINEIGTFVRHLEPLPSPERRRLLNIVIEESQIEIQNCNIGTRPQEKCRTQCSGSDLKSGPDGKSKVDTHTAVFDN